MPINVKGMLCCPIIMRVQVQILGCIVEATQQSTNLKLIVEDGTGRIEVTQWTNSDDSQYEIQKRELYR